MQLTAREVSALCGVTVQTANNWLAGRTKTPHLAAQAVAAEIDRRKKIRIEQLEKELAELKR